jgi:hypothetical protein
MSTSAERPSALAQALAYAARGLSVAPFYAVIDGECNCSWWHKEHGHCNNGKHPVAHGGYTSATTDPKTIARWWAKHPDRNIGLATGPSGLLALDPDTRNGGDKVLAALTAEWGPLPPTWSVRSGSGDVRYLFRRPEGITIRTGNIKRDGGTLDIIGETGGLIVAGMHPSGNPYIDLGGEVAELPEGWVRGLTDELSLSLTPKDYSLYKGEKEKPSGARPEELTAAAWLLSKLHPGAPLVFETPTKCLLHDDGAKRTGGAFFVDAKGYVRFRCFHDHRSVGLTELYATLLRDQRPPYKASALAKLRDELYYHSGAMRPRVIVGDTSELPDPYSDVLADVVEALAVNWVSFPGEPVMYTCTFGAARLKMNKDAVNRALRRLVDDGFLAIAGRAKVGPFETPLYTTPAELFRGKAEAWKAVKNRGLTVP